MRFKTAIVLLLSISTISLASHRHNRTRSGQAGAFDYYMLVLSWSPEFCYSHPNAAQCSQHTGFTVHGLWPQRNDGSYPVNLPDNAAGAYQSGVDGRHYAAGNYRA